MIKSMRMAAIGGVAVLAMFLGGCVGGPGGPDIAIGAGYPGYGAYDGPYYGGYGPYYGDNVIIGNGYNHRRYYGAHHVYGGGYHGGHTGRFTAARGAGFSHGGSPGGARGASVGGGHGGGGHR